MKKTSLILMLTAVATLFFSCSTDFDLKADWKDIAVVYAILDPTDTAQYVKLNKAFLGDADAYEMAQESDSLFYPEAEVFLDDGTGNPIKLEPTNEIVKDSGIFAYDYNQLYKTTATLNASRSYDLLIQIPGKGDVTSTTSLIETLDVTKPSNNVVHKVGLASDSETLEYKTEFYANEVGEIYSLTLRFHWMEYMDGDIENATYHSLEWPQSSKSKLSDNEEMFMTIDGASFYQYLASNIEASEGGLKREAIGIDFIFTVAGTELASYIEVNGPSDGIIQERPNFTNITNGIGVFSSRYTKTIELVTLSPLSLNWLSCSETTSHLRFADGYGNFDCL